MLQYDHETQHEKMIRGLALGISMIMYGREEEADVLIEQLCSDKVGAVALCCIFSLYSPFSHTAAVAMAYSGTGNNKAIRRLLHVAVSDVNDDVRRAAVTALGFLLFRTPKRVPRIVQLLSESYNPPCATRRDSGSGYFDPVDYVRQGALIALSMILVQHNESANPKVGSTREVIREDYRGQA
ncbi:proteasome regulatory particle base subunit [Borealophlyctis nickersoniae]|nr:proteasome regulatory particle base subunit [Borealophlyctis nickersoniae]